MIIKSVKTLKLTISKKSVYIDSTTGKWGTKLEAPMALRIEMLKASSGWELRGGHPLLIDGLGERRELRSGIRGVLELSKHVWTHIVATFGQSCVSTI